MVPEKGSTQAVVLFTRIVPAIGEPGAESQVEIFCAASIPDEVDLGSREEVVEAVDTARSDIPAGTPWMIIGYSNN